MLIDWFTVGAQVLNFLILVWLLKRYLYKPILTAIDAREKRIADELADADAKKAAAQKERDDFQAKNKAFDEQRAALLGKATGDAKAEHDRLIEEAHKAADDLRTRQANALKSDQTQLGDEIARVAGDEVFAIARKALGDLATASLEERMSDVLIRRLREMEAHAKETMAEAFKASSEPAVVRSTFDLPAGQREAIQKALAETFSTQIQVKFEKAAEGLAGIELTVSGRKLTWSIAGYLASMQHKVGLLLDSKREPVQAAAPDADADSASRQSPTPPQTPTVAVAAAT
jgi:F-type H+-transporting ATPase subunit b